MKNSNLFSRLSIGTLLFLISFLPDISLSEELVKSNRVSYQLNLFDSALAQAGLTTKDIRFDQDEIATWGGDRWRLSYFSLFHNNPFKLPTHSQLLLEGFQEHFSDFSYLVAIAGRLTDHPIRRGLIGDQLNVYTTYPDSVIKPSITRSKNILIGSEFADLKDWIDLIYNMANDNDYLLKKALEKTNKEKFRKRLFSYFIEEDDKQHDFVYEMAEKVDLNRLIAAGQDFAEAVQRLDDSTLKLFFPKIKREIKTRKGLIVIGSTGDDIHQYYTPPLIIIDGSGNDEYRFSGYPDYYPLSIIVDLSGDDSYISTDSLTPGIGGAVLSVSILYDKQGDDKYLANHISQGGALFGVSLLYDGTGDDLYSAQSMSQGAATFGIGILADNSGNDSMYCLSTSQGFGYTQGCGLLLNMEGDDRYVAEDDEITNPSPQTKEHNSSLAQGVGFGKRADYLDGHSWAGGIGILCDIKGDDIYSAGLFAQGCAYWFSLGMMIDGSGNDRYNGIWYVQGSGAHFGVGFLDDFDGDDNYLASHNMALGAGHDFTVGYLNERGGNDSYHAPNLSLGAGNANGIGLFDDWGGDDNYYTGGETTLGKVNITEKGIRSLLPVVGIFIDRKGRDNYSESIADDHSRWLQQHTEKGRGDSIHVGVGLDW